MTSAVNSEFLSKYSLNNASSKDEDPNRLLQDDFLKLMTEQLKNQDPMSPTDNGEFLGQMAQFSSAASMKSLQTSFDTFAESMNDSLLLNAASLIGKKASLPANATHFDADKDKSVSGNLELPEAGNDVNIKIYNSLGENIKTLQLGTQTGSTPIFEWDGTDESGSQQPPGNYEFYAEYTPVSGGEAEPAIVYIDLTVESVSLNNGSTELHTRDGATHKLADTRTIS